MLIVVTYDVVDNRRRVKVHKLLMGYGDWRQYSVFECDLTERRYREMLAKIGRLIDRDEDSVCCYRLCALCRAGLITMGTARPFEEERVVVI